MAVRSSWIHQNNAVIVCTYSQKERLTADTKIQDSSTSVPNSYLTVLATYPIIPLSVVMRA